MGLLACLFCGRSVEPTLEELAAAVEAVSSTESEAADATFAGVIPAMPATDQYVQTCYRPRPSLFLLCWFGSVRLGCVSLSFKEILISVRFRASL